ncbi:phosphatase PAP2 family protein [Actinomycetospora termitidis]|uniref:Phosphatase PAP2 family protein n=1 Tax=Actinomycetospora termitidis TaxID=3053470 RepID=A0ABT7M224_9PSEU|nr:phosphatase PAP2 family protein [Actinomycetospora sp. Odt1-22]MDL5154701.1 phosphatase PAP2 family protein [Actinomycetospora sp. Odt1-22]
MLDASGSREAAALVAIQRRIDQPAVVRAATAMSLFGEHAAGWLAIGTAGAALDPTRRREWASSAVAVAGAHGASIVLKRIVRRRRPHDPRIAVHVGTPSRLSFPSSHATSTTAAAVAYGSLLGRPGAAGLAAVIPTMALSRLVLGVHYPTDVLAGSVLGAGCALAARRVIERGRLGRWRTR